MLRIWYLNINTVNKYEIYIYTYIRKNMNLSTINKEMMRDYSSGRGSTFPSAAGERHYTHRAAAYQFTLFPSSPPPRGVPSPSEFFYLPPLWTPLSRVDWHLGIYVIYRPPNMPPPPQYGLFLNLSTPWWSVVGWGCVYLYIYIYILYIYSGPFDTHTSCRPNFLSAT